MRRTIAIGAMLMILLLSIGLEAREYTGWKAEVEMLILKGDFTAALTQLIAQEKAGNVDADFYFLRAKAQTGKGDFKNAEEDVNKALEMDPEFVSAIGHLAVIQLHTGRFKEALQNANKALKMDQDHEIYYCRGAVYVAMSRFAEALSDLDTAIGLSPEKSDYYVARGEVQLRLRQYKQAEKDFTRAIELNPNDAKAYLGRGGMYLLQGNKADARKDLDRCIKLDPKYSLGYLRRGKYFQVMRMRDRALDDYKKATELAPGNQEAWFERAMLELEMEKFDDAEESGKKLIGVASDRSKANKVLGLIYTARGKREEAVQAFTEALRRDPKDPESLVLRGNTYAFLKRFDEAMADFDKAIELAADYLDPYMGKASLYVAQNQPEKALEVYEGVLKKSPDNITVLTYRAELYKQMGRYEESLADLKRINEIKTQARESQ